MVSLAEETAFFELAFLAFNLVVEILILISFEKIAIEKVYLVADIRTTIHRFIFYFFPVFSLSQLSVESHMDCSIHWYCFENNFADGS